MISWWRGLLVAVGVLLGVFGMVVAGAGLPGQPDPVGPRVMWNPMLDVPSVPGTVLSVKPDPRATTIYPGVVTAVEGESCPGYVYQMQVLGQDGPVRLMGCQGALAVGEQIMVRVYEGVKPTAMWAVPTPAGFGWPGYTVAGLGLLMAGMAGWSLVRSRGSVWPAPVAAVSRWVPVHVVLTVVTVAVTYAMFGEPEYRWRPGSGFVGLVAAALAVVGAVWWVRSRGWLLPVRSRFGASVGAQTVSSLAVLYVAWGAVDSVAAESGSIRRFLDGWMIEYPHTAVGVIAVWVLQASAAAVLGRAAWRGRGVVRAIGVGGAALFVGLVATSALDDVGDRWPVLNAVLTGVGWACFAALVGSVVAVAFCLVMPVVRRARERRVENRAALAAREAGVGG